MKAGIIEFVALTIFFGLIWELFKLLIRTLYRLYKDIRSKD